MCFLYKFYATRNVLFCRKKRSAKIVQRSAFFRGMPRKNATLREKSKKPRHVAVFDVARSNAKLIAPLFLIIDYILGCLGEDRSVLGTLSNYIIHNGIFTTLFLISGSLYFIGLLY